MDNVIKPKAWAMKKDDALAQALQAFLDLPETQVCLGLAKQGHTIEQLVQDPDSPALDTYESQIAYGVCCIFKGVVNGDF